MNKEFEAFKQTLSEDSLKQIYDETKIELSETELEGSDAFSFAFVSQMAVNLVEKYHDWLQDDKSSNDK